MHCLQCFSSEDVLNKHKTECIVINNGEHAIKLPREGEKIKFINHNRKLQVPFVIYMHISKQLQKKLILENQIIVNLILNHIVDLVTKSSAVMMISIPNELKFTEVKMRFFKFMEKMIDEVKYCRNTIKYKFNKPLKMTSADEEKFKQATECHMQQKI